MSRPFDHSDYITAMTADQLLNSSIVTADIREGFEEYLDIFDRFYAADVEVRSEGSEDSVIGKAAVLSRLSAFVCPLHAFAEVGGLSVSIRVQLNPTDSLDETQGFWALEMTGVTGRRCVLTWTSLRRWHEGRVVYERLSEFEQTGGPLTEEDLYVHPYMGESGEPDPKMIQ